MTQRNDRQTTPAPLQRADAAGIILLTALLLFLSVHRSRGNAFWGDEIMGLAVLQRPTFAGALDFWRHGIDSSGIWFYVFGRPWIHFFGPSEVSLRLYSATGIAASAAVLWAAARCLYPVLPVAAAVTFVYAFLEPLRWQLANGRTYGVFMLSVALVIYMMLRGEDESATRPTPLFLLATFAAYALLNGSHILGVLYAAAFFGMQLGLDLYRRRPRPLLYVAALCSFAVVLFSRANIQATAALGKPTFWTLRPGIRELFSNSVVLGPRVTIPVALLLVFGFLHLRVRRDRMPVCLILLGFAALDLVIFIYSRRATSIYVDRYLMPFAVAGVLLLCELLTQLREADAPWPRLRAALPFVFLAMALVGFFARRWQADFYPFPDYTSRLIAALPPRLPIIDADVRTFVDTEFYQHGRIHRTLQFPVDWKAAFPTASTIDAGVSGFHEMDNWKTVGLYADDILPTDQILAGKSDFIVLVNPLSSGWFRLRILADPHYAATKLSTFSDGHFVDLEIWSVHTK